MTEEESRSPMDNPDSVSGYQTLRLPLSRTKTAVIQLPEGMDERAWKRMLTILDAMKPGIVDDSDASDDESEPE